MSDANDPQEIERLRARLAELEAKRPSKSGWGFSGGYFGCFGVLGALLTLVVLLAALGQCSRDVATHNSSSTTVTPTAPSSKAQSQVPPESEISTWTYTETADAMHDTKTKFACVTSTNEVRLDFPYHDTTAQVCLRKSPQYGLDAFISLNGNGQILCGIESCTVHVRFDKGAVQSFPGVEPADHSSNVLFINSTQRLISALKKSSTTVVELQFFQQGSQQLIFNTKGLKWP